MLLGYIKLKWSGENTMKIRQADPRDCIWLTAQVHEHSKLQQCVWQKMIDIMDKENEIRYAELQKYECISEC